MGNKKLGTILFAMVSFIAVAVVVFVINIKPAPAAQDDSSFKMPDFTSTEPDVLPFGEYLAARNALTNSDFKAAADFYLEILKLEEENVEINQSALNVFITDGRIEEAIKIAHRLKGLEQENDLSKQLLYFETVKNRDYETAITVTDDLGETGISNLIKPFFKAWMLASLNRTSEVEEIIAGFEENTTFNFFNFYQSGLLFEYMGNLDKAEEFLGKALIEKGFLNYRAVEAYGYILRKQGKNDEAISHYQKYLADSPRNGPLLRALEETEQGKTPLSFVTSVNDGFSEIFYSVATVLMQDNVRRVATNFLQYSLYFRDDFPLANFLQAQIYDEDEYYEGAAKELSKIDDDHPMYLQAKLQRAWLFDDMDQSDKALEELKKIEKEFPENREVLNSVAEFYRMHERYADAIPAYTKIITNITESGNRDWIVYYTRGIVYHQEEMWDEAEKDFLKALEINPEQPMVLNYLAYSWVDMGMHYDRAKKMLERAVELRPNDGYIVDSLGWALFKMGDDDEAVTVLERAAQLQTQDWAINDHLGDAYWTVGRKNEARFQWRHALSLSPDEDKIDLIKSKIKNGYSKP